MDSTRFDDLTRRVASTGSRRSALRAMAGMGSGLLLVLTGRGAAADFCKTDTKACSKGSQCCSGNCAPATGKSATSKSSSICCPAGQVQLANGTCGCPAGGCVCPTGQVDCGAGCIPGECCTERGDPRCDNGIECSINTCVSNLCVHTDHSCDDDLDCTTDFCDHVVGACVNVEIGGSTPQGLPGGLCGSGEFFANGFVFGPIDGPILGPGGCDSQYLDSNWVCTENPNPCTKQGLACTTDSECCFGLPCTMGYCYQRAV
jgi:hypothetical protein